ncbi:triacylglycerol lipase [Microbacterium sp. W4I20]|uniref:esterase/lipase family protein n=1 Tax=Microbacterium sp. W4I20 TaxID=3042262 RepID=UPI00278179A1|nr:alpha/beta hydrolase [Microbacterium sp. W4I20]MDQ0725467.1 pimeloyl-ACP methyl ester carboxylesterase [Microbacterium sp. W4I20]
MKAAAWWAADYAYAGYWQVRAFFDRADANSFATGDAAHIVVLPGVYETWRFMQPLIAALHARGHPVHVIEALRRNQRPVTEMAAEVAAFLEAQELSDVILVAHSKGGLAGKLAMTGPAAGRIRSLLAVATPFGGSSYARRIPMRTLRAFSPDDPSIVNLGQQLAVNERIVSIYAEFDPHIPEGSELAGAKNVRLDTGGHFRILAHPRVLAELAVLAAEPAEPAG